MKTDDLMPIDWVRVEADYRAGIMSVREIGARRGLSHTAILKRAAKFEWKRDLQAQIRARAAELVYRQVARDAQAVVSVPKVPHDPLSDLETVMAAGAMQASVEMGHRRTARKAHNLGESLLTMLNESVHSTELFDHVRTALDTNAPTTPELLQNMRDVVELVASLPQRVKVFKDLVDALAKTISMERAAFGLNAEVAGDGRPLVIVKDFTGRGDPDAPAGAWAPV